ncbi:MAG TPA: radical SAM protein [Rhizomicrobium sp.]|jgi:sulfatase maturation enzyme AslB (radical SAM superfamily)
MSGAIAVQDAALRPDIALKLHSRLLVMARSPSEYYNLRWGLTNKGYRNFDIVDNLPDFIAALSRSAPDAILIASTLDAARQEEIARAAGERLAARVFSFETAAAEWTTPLGDYRPIRVDTLKGKVKQQDIPINIELELVSRCNARCSFCPIGDMARLGKTMSADTLDRTLTLARELPASLVYLCGVGEPLLYKGIAGVVHRIATEIGCPVGVNSNGQLLDGARFRQLLDAGLSMVNVSINGTSDGVYAEHMKYLDRDQVSRNLEEILRIKPEAVSLQGVVTAKNHHELPGLVEYWASRGVRVFTFNECSNKSGFLKGYDELRYTDMASLAERMAKLDTDAWISFNSCSFVVKQTGTFLCRVPLNFLSVDVCGNLLHCMHDFAGETSYGKLADFAADEVRELMLRRVNARPAICNGCNSHELDTAKVIWRGQVVVERNVFPDGAAPWEHALQALH